MATHIEDYMEGAHGPLEDVQGAADRYLNRELSWLDFNARVLSLADRPDVPLLERAKFLAIFSTNLDEFFQVRVAGLKDQEAAGLGGNVSLEGTSPAQQLAAIRSRVEDLLAHQDRIFLHEVVPALAEAGIRLSNWEELDEEDTAWLISEFEQRIYPVLTPLAVDPSHPFPYISNLSLSLAVMVRDPDTGQRRFARVKVPDLLPRFVVLPDGERFVPLEQVIAARLSSLFPGMEIESHHPFRVTRNADLTLEEEEADDLLAAVEVELRRRRFGRGSAWRSPAVWTTRSSPSCAESSTSRATTSTSPTPPWTSGASGTCGSCPGPTSRTRPGSPCRRCTPPTTTSRSTPSPASGPATCSSTTRTTRSRTRWPPSWPRRRPTPPCWPSSRRCTGPRARAPSWPRSSGRPRPASRWPPSWS